MKGLSYFNRAKPAIQISIGTLEEWFQLSNDRARKKLKLNYTADDLLNQTPDDMIDLDHSKAKLDKSMLHESWFEDFQKEQKK